MGDIVTADEMRSGKAYTVAQAARLANTTPQNVRRWLKGYSAPGHSMKPVFGDRPADESGAMLSFLELAELIVVARYRQRSGRRIKLDRLRAAHKYARDRLGIAHPFASNAFRVEGGHVIHEFEEAHEHHGAKIAVDVGGVFVLPLDLTDTLDLFDFDGESIAVRFYPRGKSAPIVIDPEHAAGRPSIIGSNVRLEVLVERWRAGQRIADLEDDFEIPASTLEAAFQAA